MLRRLLTVVMVLGALSAPLPLVASICAPQHSCCAPAGGLTLDTPDCCQPAVCAAPEQETELAIAVPSTPFSSPADDVPTMQAVLEPLHHEVARGLSDSPPLTRLRLARLSTLLI